MDHTHKHQCPDCGCVWEHANKIIDAPRSVHEAAHHCPKCGARQTGIYSGIEPAEFTDHHEMTAKE